jgi:hypothetical protein
MLAAITRSNNAYTGAANPTLANVGQQAVNAGTTSGMVSGYVDAAKAQSERENAEAMARSFKGQESNIASQRARAASLRGKGMPQARMVGEGRWATLTQPNWGEQLEGVTNQLVGGYLEGQARKDAEQLDVDVTEQTRLVLATEAAEEEAALALDAERYGIEQGNINRTFDQNAEQNLATNALATDRNNLTRSGQKTDRDKLPNLTIVDIDGSNPRNIVQGQEIPEGAILASSWIDRNTSEAAMIEAFGGKTPLTPEQLAKLSPAQIDSIGRRQIIENLGSAGERDRANLLVNAASEFQKLIPVGQQMIEDGTGYELIQQAFGPASKILVPEEMEAVISNMVIEKTYTPEQMKWLGGIANAFASLRKADTGANVTAIEVELQSLFDPTVTGLTVEQRNRRLSDILNTVNTELENIGLKGFDVVEIEGKNNSGEARGQKPLEEMTDEELEAELNG